jgi:hypothetical protein
MSIPLKNPNHANEKYILYIYAIIDKLERDSEEVSGRNTENT